MLWVANRGNAHEMADSAADLVPSRPSLPKLREAAAGCRACPLWEDATQTVFGAGNRSSIAMFVGEQPGDREDREGAPFVGPAGRVLDEALAQVGIDRQAVYVTNAVKHFKWEPRGKRRIHAKPSWSELTACRPWLEAELAVVRPNVLVCLGATAAQSLLGRQFRVTKQRGEWLDSDLADHVTATIHPSAILRQRDDESRQEEMARFVEDLKLVASVLARSAVGSPRAGAKHPRAS
jgi:DNA polymerase